MTGGPNLRAGQVLAKHSTELKAYINGSMPAFAINPEAALPLTDVPVFVFHNVTGIDLEIDLTYLRSNGYDFVNASELEEKLEGATRNGHDVALTFDDADWTFWTYTYPLLKRYNAKAILFSIAGLVPIDEITYPNLEDLWGGQCSLGDLERRRQLQPLCTWREIGLMHASGIVDIQSHSLTHTLIPISSRVVDFHHPDFDRALCDFNIPVSASENHKYAQRAFRLGTPVFESASRLSGALRFKEPPELASHLTRYVAKEGGETFFGRRGWRRELREILDHFLSNGCGIFESRSEMERSLRKELLESKRILERKLPGKTVSHFAYPWFVGSKLADDLAVEAGYRCVHYGLDIDRPHTSSTDELVRIQRIPREYVRRLPGAGRVSLASVWIDRARHYLKRREIIT